MLVFNQTVGRMDHQHFLDIAVEHAHKGMHTGGKGSGAVLVKDGSIVAGTHDRTLQLRDPIAVAEVDCVRQAGRRDDQKSLTLYATRYPDMLCAGTLIQFSIGKLVIGRKPKQTTAIELLQSKDVPVEFCPHSGCLELDDE